MAAFEIPLASTPWPFKANWRERVESQYEFKTTIKVSQNGKEQRRALRSEPRIEQTVLTSGLEQHEFQVLQRFVFENMTRPVAMPDFPSVVIAEVTSETTLAVAGLTWARPGNAVMLMKDDTIQVRHVSAYEDDVVTLTTATGLTGKVRFYPALYGYLPATLKGRLLTASVLETSTTLEAAPGLQNPVYSGEPGVMFDGREVLLRKMNWEDRAVDLSGFTRIRDSGRGRINRYNPIPFNTRLYRQSFLFETRADREDFIAFFCRMKGRRGEFFAPTWAHDLTFKSVAGTTLRCDPTGMKSRNRVERAVMVELYDGRRAFAKVNAVAETGGDLVLTLAGAFPWPIASSAVRRLCWLPLCRFGSDTLSIDHNSSVVSTADVTIQTLEYLPAS